MTGVVITTPYPVAPGLPFTDDLRYRRRRLRSQAMAGLIGIAAILGVSVLWIILGYVAVRGAPALNLAFFTERPLPYGEVGGGIAPAITGSLMLLVVAAVLGVPIGIGAAIFLVEYGKGSVVDGVRFASDLVAGLPSIVVGVFVWAALVRNVIGNFSGLAGAVALAIIMVPIIIRTVEAVLNLVPHTLREAGLALGVPKWRVILGVVLPTARGGIVTGVVLSVARAGGETAPLLLTTLGNQFFNWDLAKPTGAIPIQLYNYAVAPYPDWHAKAWGAALVLILVVGSLSILARVTTRGSVR
jgi:phosphate transport system permease protein